MLLEIRSTELLSVSGSKSMAWYSSTDCGMAMNPKDHPHGGGEGRSKSGHHPVSLGVSHVGVLLLETERNILVN